MYQGIIPKFSPESRVLQALGGIPLNFGIVMDLLNFRVVRLGRGRGLELEASYILWPMGRHACVVYIHTHMQYVVHVAAKDAWRASTHVIENFC